MENWIYDRVKSTAKLRTLLWAILPAFVIFLLFADQRYVTNFLSGPYAMGTAQLDSITDLATTPKYFVRVTGSKAIDTGIRDMEQVSARDVPYQYYALDVGGKFLVVRRSDGAPTVVQGELKPLPSDFSIRLRKRDGPTGLGAPIYRFTVDDSDFRSGGYFGIFAAAIFIGIFFWFARKDIRHWRDPAKHPAMRRAAVWGDPPTIATDARNEDRAPRLKGMGWRLGEKYLVRSSVLTFDVMRPADIVWGHILRQKHSVYFVPIWSTYYIVLHDAVGSTQIQMSKGKATQLLDFVRQEAPWAILGHSPDAERAFKKQRPEFLAMVEDRKRKWNAGERG